MKRFLSLLSLLTWGTLQAEVLYWMGDSSQDQVDFVFARVAVVDNGGVITYLNDPSGGPSALAKEEGYMTGVGVADITGYTTNQYSFFVEIMNHGKPNTDPSGEDRWFVAGQSAISNYQDLFAAGYVYAKLDDYKPMLSEVWAPTVVIPEPSGALMILLGLAALNLRRRRV